MKKIGGNFRILGAIFAAALIGGGVGYVMQEPGLENRSGIVLRGHQDFLIGPGKMPSSPSPRDTRPAAPSLFEIDAQGDLLVDEKTESVLDAFLARLPANPTAVQREELEASARSGLPDRAADKAVALVRNYVNFRKAESDLPAPPEAENLTDKNILDAKLALRRRYFDPRTADALFGLQESQLIYSREVLRVASDQMLSADERRQKIMALHQALPPKVAALEFNDADFSPELEEQVAELRQRGAPDEEMKSVRLRYFGLEVAQLPKGLETAK